MILFSSRVIAFNWNIHIARRFSKGGISLTLVVAAFAYF